MSLEEFVITVFCLVAEIFDREFKEQELRSRGFEPKLTDPEVITMEIVGEFLGLNTDKGIWCYFKNHWQPWFPNLGSRSNFVRQSSNLWRVKQILQEKIAEQLDAGHDSPYMADGSPLPIARFKRSYFSRLFEGVAAYGYCASKGEIYCGFKGNVAINAAGVIKGITFTAANVDERESLFDITSNINGLLFADKGLIGEYCQQTFLAETGINLQTPDRENMEDPRGKDASSWLVSTRRLVETVIGQLTDRFNIEKNWARDLWHFTNRIARKVLSHTAVFFINKIIGNNPNPLQFENLVKT